MTILYLESLTDSNRVPSRDNEYNKFCVNIHADIKGRVIKSYSSTNNYTETKVDRKYLCYPGERVSIPTGFKVGTGPGYKIVINPMPNISKVFGLITIHDEIEENHNRNEELFITILNTSERVINILQGHYIARLTIERVNPFELAVVNPTIHETAEGTEY